MFTSDIKPERKMYLKTAIGYLCATVFFALFGAIYESFSHGVYSFYMVYAFLYPLLGGVCPFLFITLTKKTISFCSFALLFYHCALATMTVGSIIFGVLKIYGTDNSLVFVYPAVSVILFILAFSFEIFFRKRK